MKETGTGGGGEVVEKSFTNGAVGKKSWKDDRKHQGCLWALPVIAQAQIDDVSSMKRLAYLIKQVQLRVRLKLFPGIPQN